MKELTKEQQEKVRCDVIIISLLVSIEQTFEQCEGGKDPIDQLNMLYVISQLLMEKLLEYQSTSVGDKEFLQYSEEVNLFMKKKCNEIDIRINKGGDC